MRKPLIVIGIVAALLIGAVLAIPALLDVNRYRGQIQAALEERLNRGVTLGAMSLKVIPLAFSVQNVVIKEDPQFPVERPFAQVRELSVSPRFWPLLRGDVEIRSLTLERPVIELVKNAGGIWNTSTLGGSQSGANSAPHSDPPKERDFSLARLAIHDGQLAVTDLQKRWPRAIYDHIDLTLNDYAPGKSFSLVTTAYLPGKGANELKLEGQGGPVVQGDMARTPFQGTVVIREVSLPGLQSFLNSKSLAGMDGLLSGNAKIGGKAGEFAASGTINLSQARKQGAGVAFPADATCNFTLDLTGDALRIGKADLTVGKIPLSVTGLVDMRPEPVQLDLQVKAAGIAIPELARLLPAFGVALTPGMNFNGSMTANIAAKGPASRPSLNGQITARNLNVTGKQLAMPVAVSAIDLALSPAAIRSNPFNVVTGGTTLSSQFTLSGYTTPSPVIDATLRDPHAAFNELLNIARAYGATSLQGITGGGTVALDLRAAGPLKSFQSEEIARSLNGTVGLNLSNVHLPGTDINYELASVGGLLNLWRSPQAKQPFTNIVRLTGNADIRNGVAQTGNLRADLDKAAITAAGTANLVTEALNLRLNAVLAKEFTTQVGATGLAGYLTTAFSNPNAQITIPVIVTGTFRQPRYAPDIQAFSRMKLKQFLPGVDAKANPQDILKGILGGGKPNQQGQPQNPVPNLLNDLFGGRKKNTPPKKP